MIIYTFKFTVKILRGKYLFKQKILAIKSVVIGSNKNQPDVLRCCRWYTNSGSSTVDNCTVPCLMEITPQLSHFATP